MLIFSGSTFPDMPQPSQPFSMLQVLRLFGLMGLAAAFQSCSPTTPPQHAPSRDSTTDIEVQDERKAREDYYAGDVMSRGFLDKDGDMWFTALEEGVFRYDGTTFHHYGKADGLPTNQVSSVMQDRDGIMWFGTGSGICRYDGETFETIPLPKNEHPSDWLDEGVPIVNPEGVLSMLQDESGLFWIGTNGNGVFKYDGTSFNSFLRDECALAPDGYHRNVITNMVEDPAGNIWITSFSHGGVTKYDGASFTTFGMEDGLPDDMVSTAYIDRVGDVWFGTRSGGMSCFKDGAFHNHQMKEGECANHMASLLQEPSGDFWVASFARKGICKFDGESFTPFTAEGAEKLSDVKFISEDADGNVWFGGRYGILWMWDGQRLTDFTDKGW